MNFKINIINKPATINRNGFVDYALLNSENGQIIMDNYSELPLTKQWNKGDILVDSNDCNKIYVFDKFTKSKKILVYIVVITSSIDGKLSKIIDVYQSIPYTLCHKASDKELKTFYAILAERNLTWNAYDKVLLPGNNTYFYPKNGHYYFKSDTIRCKDRTTGEWYDAVLYSDANGQYAREINDFNNKFKKVEI